MTGHIILCADDYGLSPGISQAIRMLAAANRISAISAIVNRPAWPREAAALKLLAGDMAVGLHLNLTLGTPLSQGQHLARGGAFLDRNRLILSAYCGQLSAANIATEIERQLDAFESGLGMPPDHIDGHEHVHVLPVIREALLQTLKQRYGARPILIRNPAPAWAAIAARNSPALKSAVLRQLSCNMLHDVGRYGFICNDQFGGVSNFRPSVEAVMKEFKAAAAVEGWRPIVICHPGFADTDRPNLDVIAARRQMEFDALMHPTVIFKNIYRAVRRPDGCIEWPLTAVERKA